jgi:hypothetical protein
MDRAHRTSGRGGSHKPYTNRKGAQPKG